MKKPTIAELQAKCEALTAYQEAWFVRNMPAIRIEIAESSTGRAATYIDILGAHRASGGVVVEDGIPTLATEWCQRVERSNVDPCYQDAARKVRREQERASRKREEWRSTSDSHLCEHCGQRKGSHKSGDDAHGPLGRCPDTVRDFPSFDGTAAQIEGLLHCYWSDRTTEFKKR